MFWVNEEAVWSIETTAPLVCTAQLNVWNQFFDLISHIRLTYILILDTGPEESPKAELVNPGSGACREGNETRNQAWCDGFRVDLRSRSRRVFQREQVDNPSRNDDILRHGAGSTGRS